MKELVARVILDDFTLEKVSTRTYGDPYPAEVDTGLRVSFRLVGTNGLEMPGRVTLHSFRDKTVTELAEEVHKILRTNLNEFLGREL
jgi:hypothetical protein